MYYFSYATNMDPEQLRKRIPDFTVVGLGSLPEHHLSFPLYSNDWESGVASAQPHHGDQVWGVLYHISEGALAELDRSYGYQGPDDQHNVYDRHHVTVELTRPDDGSFPRPLRAWVYQARSANPSPPSRTYLDTLIRGARHHKLPEEYLAMLNAIEVAESETP